MQKRILVSRVTAYELWTSFRQTHPWTAHVILEWTTGTAHMRMRIKRCLMRSRVCIICREIDGAECGRSARDLGFPLFHDPYILCEQSMSDSMTNMADVSVQSPFVQQEHALPGRAVPSSHNGGLSIPAHGAPWITELDDQTFLDHDQLDPLSERLLASSTMMYHDLHYPYQPSSSHVQAPAARGPEHLSLCHAPPVGIVVLSDFGFWTTGGLTSARN
ncbi:hypothetical protein BKA93DRAFT_799001 [Sparassis latifolia]